MYFKTQETFDCILRFASLNCTAPKNQKTEVALIPGLSYQIAFLLILSLKPKHFSNARSLSYCALVVLV